jgi:hypothetical protein
MPALLKAPINRCQDTRMSLMRFDMKVSSFNHISFRAGVVKTCTQWRCPMCTADHSRIHSRPCSQWKHHAWEGSNRPDQRPQVWWHAMNARRCESEMQLHVEEKWLHSVRLKLYHILSRIINQNIQCSIQCSKALPDARWSSSATTSISGALTRKQLKHHCKHGTRDAGLLMQAKHFKLSRLSIIIETSNTASAASFEAHRTWM